MSRLPMKQTPVTSARGECGHRAANLRPPFVDVVDPVERLHDPGEREREIPENEGRREDDQGRGSGMEDLLRRVVDRVEDRGRDVRADLGRDAVPPRLLEAERTQQTECQQRERDERDEGAKADRRRVDEEPVLGEIVPKVAEEPPAGGLRAAAPHDEVVPRANRSQSENPTVPR
jgi:hypothetical protein